MRTVGNSSVPTLSFQCNFYCFQLCILSQPVSMSFTLSFAFSIPFALNLFSLTKKLPRPLQCDWIKSKIKITVFKTQNKVLLLAQSMLHVKQPSFVFSQTAFFCVFQTVFLVCFLRLAVCFACRVLASYVCMTVVFHRCVACYRK